MKMMHVKKKMAAVLAVLVIVSLSAMVFADVATFNPFATLAELTKKTETEIKDLAKTKSLGQIAKDAGVLEAYKAEMLQAKKAVLDQRVKDGLMTQADADKVYAEIKTRMAACDGTTTGLGKLGKGLGMGFGKEFGMGKGDGTGKGLGKGLGKGRGMGKGLGCGF